MVVRRRRWGTGALAVALLLTACRGDEATEPTTSGPTVAPPSTGAGPAGATSVPPLDSSTTAVTGPTTTALPPDVGELGVLATALAADGTVEPDAALALVAAGYRPIPGVTPAPTPLIDGGPALRTVVAGSAALRPEQQAAVAAITAPAGIPLAEAAASTSPRLAAAADVLTRSLATFGRSPSGAPPAGLRLSVVELPYDNGDGTRNFSSPESHATAVLARDGADADCRVRVNATSPLDPALGPGDPAFVATLAREAFHCLQYARSAAIEDVPVWVVEGAAAYAAEQVAGASSLSATWWERWIAQPQRPLEQRAYDAIGFFSLVGETADALAFADALLGDPTPDSVRRRLGPTDLFDRWGRRYATRPDWGPDFAFTGAGASGHAAPVTPVELVVDGEPVALGGAATTELSAVTYGLAAPGDVLVVTAGPGDRGVVRFADGQTVPLAQATQAFCVAAGGCACPGIPSDSLAVSAVGGAEVFVGIGPSSGPGPSLAARSLARWCQEVAVPPPPADAIDPCLVGTWTTRGYTAPETPGVVQRVTGGDGAVVTFGADRTVRIDLEPMRDVVIATTGTTGVSSSTTLDYRGSGTGTWRAAGGVVEIAGVDTSTFGIRVRAEGADGTFTADVDVPISDIRLAGYATLLGTGRYACTPVDLSLARVVPGVGGSAGFELSP